MIDMLNFLTIPGLPVGQVEVKIRLETVGQLKALVAVLPDAMPLEGSGMDSSGYDHVRGRTVIATLDGGALYIRHEG